MASRRASGQIDAEGRPVTLRPTASQIVDGGKAEALIEGLGEGHILLGDRGYGSHAIRARATEQKAWACRCHPQGSSRCLALSRSAAEPRGALLQQE